MNIQWRSKRLWGYIVIIIVYALAVKVQQTVITSQRQAKIISTIDEWNRLGKPVEAQNIKRKDVKQYLKITVLASKEERVYEGFVSKAIQQKLSPGQDLYWVRQEGRLELGDPVSGKVLSVAPDPDMANGMYLIRVQFDRVIPQEEKMIVARVHFVTLENVINVPIESLDVVDERYSGWRIENGRARKVDLSVSQRNGYGAIVDDGLQEGDLFVTKGQSFLKDNDLVNIIQSKE